MKFQSLFVFSILVVSSCSSPQHIRSENYYKYDWSLLGVAVDGGNEVVKHHPIYADIGTSKEGLPTFSKNLNYFVWGNFPLKHTVALSEACGDEPFRQAYIEHEFWQAAVSVVTIGLYTPRTIEIWCGKNGK